MATRHKVAIAPALVGGIGAALILLAMPAGLVETVVASSGLSEALPAAAPPLGMKARLLLACFGALMAIGFIWAGHREQGLMRPPMQENGRRSGVRGVTIMGFALSKLSWLSRSRNAEPSRGGRPALRRADAHPDAPARAPIFASRDFGGLDIFPRITPPGAERGAEAEQPAVLALPAVAAPVSLAQQPVIGEADGAFEQSAAPAAPLIDNAAPLLSRPLTVTELTARLEQGLARRVRAHQGGGSGGGVLADMPVEPPVPVREHVEDDVDQALRSALGTLRAMAERTR